MFDYQGVSACFWNMDEHILTMNGTHGKWRTTC
jgi:hypothetical protein